MRSTPSTRFNGWRFAVIPLLAPLLVEISSIAADAPQMAPVDYARQVQPLFKTHCYRCHGAEKQESGLRLDEKSAAMRGGDSGVAIVPGVPSDSVLIELISGDDPDRVMPPTDETLTPTEIALLKRWIAEGARWPEEVTDAE